LITCTERHEHGDRGVSLETKQPQANNSNPRQSQSEEDDTYGKCIKYRPSAPMPSSLPSSSTPTRRAAEPIRYGNFYTPLCMESSPLESYVCPLFVAQCQSGHSSQSLDVPSPKSSPQQDRKGSPPKGKPIWQQQQSAQLKSAALGVGFRKSPRKLHSKLPCMDSYANVQVTNVQSVLHPTIAPSNVSTTSNVQSTTCTPPTTMYTTNLHNTCVQTPNIHQTMVPNNNEPTTSKPHANIPSNQSHTTHSQPNKVQTCAPNKQPNKLPPHPDVTKPVVTSVININHMQFHPSTNLLGNPVQLTVQHIGSENHDQPSITIPLTNPELQPSEELQPRIKLQLTCDNDQDSVMVHLHLYEGLGHRLLEADGTNIMVPPKGPFCQKNGKVRKNYRLPYFSDRHNWSLRDTYLEGIFDKAREYDSTNGHIFPPQQQWTDAFTDPSGNNAKFPQYWTPLNNAFKHPWKDTNIYAFPPMNDDIILKTLQYHIAQQQIANSQGTAFRGIYIVPYQPRASYWQYTSHFQLLKYYRAGTPLFQSAEKHGKCHTIQSSVPMCVLYDMGYTLPNYQLAYLHAMDLASSALETSLSLGCFNWDELPNEATTHVPLTSPAVGTPTTPMLQHLTSTCVNQDGAIEDITPPNLFTQATPNYGDMIASVRVRNMLFCKGDPIDLPSNLDKPIDKLGHELQKLSSIGKLTNILDQNNPDWDNVDAAIAEHIQVLKQVEEDQKQEDDNIQPLDPTMFTKSWEHGGLLSNTCLNHISANPQTDPNILIGEKCMVLKTKINNKHYNTSLVDEGATDSVLNIDWYEHQGIDWRTEFNVPEDAQVGTIYMADHTPVTTKGTATANVTLIDGKGKSFNFKFHCMSLGKYNYAQILGIDWKNQLAVVTFNPEYKLWIRELGVEVITRAMPFKLFHSMYHPTVPPDKPVEESTPKQISKDIRALSARLRRMHVYVPPTAFLRQIVVRPAKDDEVTQANTTPNHWEEDTSLLKRAQILRQRIEDTYRTQYKDVLDGEPIGLNTSMPHQHVIEVKEGTAPFSRKLKRLSPLEVDLLSKYLKEMIDGGRIKPSSSPWGANVLFVPKPDGSYRCVQDYRELNKRMKHDTYPLPRIDVHLDMAQGVFFSKMDLLKGFYQLPMHPDSTKYTAFNTMLGKFEFLVMPMGLQNAPGSFMRAMNLIFDGLIWDPNCRKDSGILVYLDDIVIFSKTEEQHMEILKEVLDRLRKHKLQCRFDKCTFATTEVEYLGFMLSAQGVRMNPDKVNIVKDWSEYPTSKTDIRAFLGIVNYLKRFCKGLSHHSAILSDWSSDSCKDLLRNSPIPPGRRSIHYDAPGTYGPSARLREGLIPIWTNSPPDG
jgi:hypothetical protein